MGYKRFFEDGEFHEHPSKHRKHVYPLETYPCVELARSADIPVESDGLYYKFQMGTQLEDENKVMVSHFAEKEVEISAPYSWLTSSSSEEDSGSGAAVCSSFSQEHLDFYFPRKSNVEPENTYSSFLDNFPAIEILIGSDHQAELPEWDPQAREKCWFGSDHIGHNCVEKYIGECVTSIPDLEFSSEIEISVGDGIKDCTCPDEGSARCVQLHVREARDSLRADVGPESFVKLGFCDMGEEVSQLWTEDEECLFHHVVYSNPVSRGKNFWENLSAEFPSRTKKEIVSYYFNVFTLQRRSVQNRSNFLDIDSDDDEWNVSYWEPVEYAPEDDNFESDSPLINEDIEVNYEDDLPIVNDIHDKDGERKDGLAEQGNGFEHGYLVEPSCNPKAWDESFPMRSFNFNNEFISTVKVIEEIFGASPSSG